MPYVMIHHQVKDYSAWKPVFDDHGRFRKENGSKGGTLYRNLNNPNDLVTIFEWDDLEKGKKFSQSDNLKETMEKAGVIGRPDVYFLEQVAKIQA